MIEIGNYVGIEAHLDVAAVLDFVDSGHDLILAADAGASDWIRNIAAESGVDFDEVCRVFFVLVEIDTHF